MKAAMITMALVGAVSLGFLLAEVDLTEVWSQLRQVETAGFVLLFLVYALRTFFNASAWLLTLSGVPISLTWVARVGGVLLAGMVLEKTTPLAGFGGEPMKVIVLKRFYGISYTNSTASLVLRRTVDVIALTLFLPLALMLGASSDVIKVVGPTATIAGVGGLAASAWLFVAVQRSRLFSRARRRFERKERRHRSDTARRVLDAVEGVENTLESFYRAHPRRLAMALMAGLGELLAGAAAVYVGLYLLDQPGSIAQALAVEAFVLLVTAVFFFVPANIGTQDGALVLACSVLLGSTSVGLALAALRRARDLLWLLGGMLLGVYYSAKSADGVAVDEASTGAL